MPNSIARIQPLAFLTILGLAAVGCGGQQGAPSTASATYEPSSPASDTQPALTEGHAAENNPYAARDAAEQELAMRAAEVARREAEIASRESQVASAERTARAKKENAAAATRSIAEADRGDQARTNDPGSLPSTTHAATQTVADTRTIMLDIPSMTALDVEFLDDISSETSMIGDRFSASVVNDVMQDGHVAIPAGSWVSGSVTEVQSSKKIGGQAKLGLVFDRVQLQSGDESALHATLLEAGKSQTKKDAATIGGAAAGGALLGKILKKGNDGKATVLGAVVGAAVGSAIASRNPGDPVSLTTGTIVQLRLDQPLQIVIRQGVPHFADYAQNN